MYDEQKPREHEIAPELAALERQLRAMAPKALRVDRDHLMFAAGQAAATAGARRDGRAMYDRAGRPLRITGRFWPAATFTMTAATLLLATMLVWQREGNQFAAKGEVSPPSTNQVFEQPLVAIAPSLGELAKSPFGSPEFQHPYNGYLGIRYVSLTRGVDAWESNSQASTSDGDSYSETPRTQRKMLEELLPSRKRQIDPRS